MLQLQACQCREGLPVPQRDHFVRESPLGCPILGPCQAKVGNLQVALVVDEQVGGLQVSVEDVFGVAIAEALQQLAHVALHLHMGNRTDAPN